MENKKRYTLVDVLRGIAVVAMIIYHTLWDLVYVYGVDIPWFFTEGASVFQAYIRWSFIFISGFSWSLGRKRLKRALTVIGASLIITAVTMIAVPADRIIFGVLTFLGVAMLLMIPLDKLLSKVPPVIGFTVGAIIFFAVLGVPSGYVGFGKYTVLLPEGLYANYFTSFLGFPAIDFISADYVPLIPWIFLFISGYFLYNVLKKYKLLSVLSVISVKPVEWIGRNALVIYMLHQPVVYGALYLLFNYILKK